MLYKIISIWGFDFWFSLLDDIRREHSVSSLPGEHGHSTPMLIWLECQADSAIGNSDRLCCLCCRQRIGRKLVSVYCWVRQTTAHRYGAETDGESGDGDGVTERWKERWQDGSNYAGKRWTKSTRRRIGDQRVSRQMNDRQRSRLSVQRR